MARLRRARITRPRPSAALVISPKNDPLDAPRTPALHLAPPHRTSGGIGRRAGFRFRYRKVWGFKSLLVHSLALRASGALVGTWGDYVSAYGVAFVSKSLLVHSLAPLEKLSQAGTGTHTLSPSTASKPAVVAAMRCASRW